MANKITPANAGKALRFQFGRLRPSLADFTLAGNPTNQPERQVECTIPILPVRDLRRSIRFYTETLGFKLDWGGENGSIICSVSNDGHGIMLSQSAMGNPGVWVWIGLEDDSLFHLYRSRGVKVRQEPKNHSWAWEMKFEDLDGNVLWLGTEARKDRPLEDRRHG